MNMLVNDKVVSCDKNIKAILKAQGFEASKNDAVDVMQFRNSVTILATNKRVITENDYEDVVAQLLALTA
ncbi:hypothetical protein NVP1009O_50 [Vibrio phage 1.009.O._10N.261.51.C9]|nr:hypothetical protein NVP1009O_50 [Vibrio phage 1.009.O._10N.261.51.C9]